MGFFCLVYAVGGQDGVQCLNHVERYDPKGEFGAFLSPSATDVLLKQKTNGAKSLR